MGEYLINEGGREKVTLPAAGVVHPIGIPPEVAPPIPVETPPNRTDTAWERLLKLREEAGALGIEVDEAWPIQRLIEEIAAKS